MRRLFHGAQHGIAASYADHMTRGSLGVDAYNAIGGRYRVETVAPV